MQFNNATVAVCAVIVIWGSDDLAIYFFSGFNRTLLANLEESRVKMREKANETIKSFLS